LSVFPAGRLFDAKAHRVFEEDDMLKQINLKPVIAGAALLAFAGSSYVFAQQGFGGYRGFGNNGLQFQHHHPMSANDMAAFTEARIAALKAGLQLTPDQTKNWPPFEQAVRDAAQLRIQRMQARQQVQSSAPSGDQQAPSSPFDRLSRRADNMAKTSAALKKVADAGAPLYQSLNDDQKGRFMVLARMLRPHHRMHGMQEHGPRFGEGYGNGGQGNGQDFDGHGWRQRPEHNGPRFGQGDDNDDNQKSQL
jgi:hypothetical protein